MEDPKEFKKEQKLIHLESYFIQLAKYGATKFHCISH
jgi:hypothetical protein